MLARLLLCMLSTLVMCSPAFAEAAKLQARALLSKYGDDLAATWQKYPGDKQKDSREAQLKVLTETFNKELPAAELHADITYSKAITVFLDNVDRSRQLFKVDKMASTRTQYVTACVALFKREASSATDGKDPRNTQQCFDLLLKWMEEVRDQLRQAPADVQSPACSAINEAFGNLLANATVPEKLDPVNQLEDNLKAARRAFPTSTPDLKKINEPLFRILETRAKEIQAKAKK